MSPAISQASECVAGWSALAYPAPMIVRFDIRPDGEGWTIYDRTTDEPAVVDGYVSVGLAREDADEIADLLNTLALIKRETVH